MVAFFYYIDLKTLMRFIMISCNELPQIIIVQYVMEGSKLWSN